MNAFLNHGIVNMIAVAIIIIFTLEPLSNTHMEFEISFFYSESSIIN